MAQDINASARNLNVVLGLWLLVSAFLWPHTPSQFSNTWVVGLLIAVVALVSTRVPEARFLNTILAVWLFVSLWALPQATMATSSNHVIVAIIVFVASLLPSYLEKRGTPPV